MVGNPLNPVPGVSDVVGAMAVDPRTLTAEAAQQQPAQAVAVAVPENAVRKHPPHERVLIRKWLTQARVPQWLQDGYNQWEADRKYISTDLFGDQKDHLLSVNLAARAIQAKAQKIAPSDADLLVTHKRSVGTVEFVRRDAIRKANAAMQAAGIMPNAQALMMAAAQAEQAFRDDQEARERFCQTSESLAKQLWDDAHGTDAAEAMANEGMTTGIAWMKVGWQRDFSRDSLGASRMDDAQDQLAMLSFRAAEFAAGLFGEDDPRYAELVQLSDYARYVGGMVTSGQVEPGSIPFAQWQGIADTREGSPLGPQWLPEPDAWQGATIDGVRPEAMRWDWTVPFKRWHDSAWLMEQNLMRLDDLCAKFELTPAERDLIGSRDADTAKVQSARNTPATESEQADPDRTTYEDQVQRGMVVVWERWDKSLRRRILFTEGLPFFLVNEIPRNVGPRFYPYVAVAFNVLDGKHLPVSDVYFLRKIQNAINQRLVDGEESLWASMKRYLVKKGAFKDGEIAKLRGAVPHDVIEVEDPDEIAKTFKEIASDDWNPAKYDLTQLFRLFELVSGMSISELGVTGQAEFATEAQIANASSQQTSGRHARVMAKAITEAMQIILHYAAANLSERTVIGMCGMGAFWPQAPSRADLIRAMSFKVRAAGSTEASRAQAGTQIRETISALGQVVQLRQAVLMQGGQFNADPLNAAIFRLLDTDAPVREVISFPNGLPMLGAPGAPPAGVPASPQPDSSTAGQPPTAG